MPTPLSKLDERLARRIELVGFDVDGVLTDGGVHIGAISRQDRHISSSGREESSNHNQGAVRTSIADTDRVEMKRFDIQDRVGIKLLRDSGIRVAWVSGRCSDATTLCAGEIGIDDLVQDPGARKLPAFVDILARHSIPFENAAFVGDDLPDIPLLKRVGLSVTVANATRDVAEIAQYATEASGGRGAVREFCEELLRARGTWRDAVTRYLAERDETIFESTNASSTS